MFNALRIMILKVFGYRKLYPKDIGLVFLEQGGIDLYVYVSSLDKLIYLGDLSRGSSSKKFLSCSSGVSYPSKLDNTKDFYLYKTY